MRIALFVCITACVISGVAAESLWKNQSLYVDRKANRVGDIVTIFIVESSSAKSSAGTDTKESTGLSLSGGPHTGELNFLPLFSSTASGDHQYKGNGNTSRTGTLTATITAQVIDVLSNGNLVLEGQREVLINGEKETITIRGIARPEDIASDNKIRSSLLADASISYNGKGTVSDGSQPGILTRFINWLF